MRIVAGQPVTQKWKNIEIAMCLAGGLDPIEDFYPEKDVHAAAAEFPFGISLREVLLIGAKEEGYYGTSNADVAEIFRAAFGPSQIRAEGYSNVQLPGVLSNVMNKFLNQGFNAVETAWKEIASRRSVPDFKQVSSYSLTGDLTYELVGPTGEVKSGTLGEQKYTNQIATYGKLLRVSRTDLINDDLGALTLSPQRLGRGAALAFNKVFWTAFLAGVGSFWAAGNNNLITGATTTLTAVGLTAALLKFRQQTDPDGMPLGITPKVLLVPPELEVTGKQLMNSTFFNTGGSSTTDQVPNENTWQGAYRLAASTYLSNPNFTGYSATAWWLLADAADLPTMEVAFLNGKDTPFVETAKADMASLGLSFRGIHDFGCAAQEPRGSVRSAGA